MSDFAVKWQDVGTFTAGIEVLDRASEKAHDYSDHVRYDVGVGDIMGHLGQLTTGNPEEVAACFGYLQTISHLSAAELVKVTAYYHHTDHAVAARFDRTY